MKYPTKVDWWLAGLVSGLSMVCLVGGIWLIIQNNDWPLGLAGIATGLAIMAISWPTYYRLADQRLLIRAGLFRWRIPVLAIQGVHPSHSPLSSPAWSLKRLRVDYTKPSGRATFVLISPRDADLFLRDLAGMAEHLELRRDHLVRN